MCDGQRSQPEVRGQSSWAVYLPEQNQMVRISEQKEWSTAALKLTKCSQIQYTAALICLIVFVSLLLLTTAGWEVHENSVWIFVFPRGWFWIIFGETLVFHQAKKNFDLCTRIVKIYFEIYWTPLLTSESEPFAFGTPHWLSSGNQPQVQVFKFEHKILKIIGWNSMSLL